MGLAARMPMNMSTPRIMESDAARSGHAFLTTLQWLSPGFPIGAFAYSHGLEWAIAEERVTDAASLEAWLIDLFSHGSAKTDAILLARAAQGQDPAALDDWARSLAASHERRIEAHDQGRAFSRILRDAWHHAPTPDYTLPVALGHAAHLEGLAPESVTAAYLHAFAANLTSVALRLVPLGQTDGQRVQRALAPFVLTFAKSAQSAPDEELSSAAFLSDIASMAHATLEPRIFKT
jgi:urease accessory protein